MTAPSARPAAFFDLDKTIIARSSTFAFSRPFLTGGLISRRAVLRSTYAHMAYQLGGADHEQMERMRASLSRMVTGWDVEQVRSIVGETLQELIEPVVYREAAALIAEHHAGGRDVVIVSSSGSELVEPIGRMLGADHVIATRMVERDGRYTGEIDFYAYGPAKAAAVRRIAAREGYDLEQSSAYSDSFTDLPMLEAVGHPHAVNPDRALRREAVARGWPVLDFTQPVPLRRRLAMAGPADRARSAGRPDEVAAAPATGHRPVLPAQRVPTVAVALGAGAATAGLVWLAARRRERG